MCTIEYVYNMNYNMCTCIWNVNSNTWHPHYRTRVSYTNGNSWYHLWIGIFDPCIGIFDLCIGNGAGWGGNQCPWRTRGKGRGGWGDSR